MPNNSVGTSQRGEIARDVGRAAGHETFALKIHHRHRRFRRNPRHAAPDEMVEHHVADHQHARLARSGQNLPDAGVARVLWNSCFYESVEKRGQRAGRAGGFLLRGQSSFISGAARLRPPF